MRTTVLIDGKKTPVELRMWSKKKRDEIERKYGIPGSAYVNMVVGALSQGRGPALQLAKDLIQKETERQDMVGSAFNVEMIMAVAFKTGDEGSLAPFTSEEIGNLPDDVFEELQREVTQFLLGIEDKFAVLKVGLSEKIRDEALREEILKFIGEVQAGRVEAKN